jgi:hydrogenase 3 maturation protease
MNRTIERIESITRGHRVAVVGVGQRLRGDDGAGSLIAEALRGRLSAPVFDAGDVPENFIGPLLEAGVDLVLFVDAAAHGGRTGEACLAPLGELAERANTTHTASLALCGRLLEAEGAECWLLGVEPGSTAFGEELTPAMARGVRRIEALLLRALPPAEGMARHV